MSIYVKVYCKGMPVLFKKRLQDFRRKIPIEIFLQKLTSLVGKGIDIAIGKVIIKLRVLYSDIYGKFRMELFIFTFEISGGEISIDLIIEMLS